MTKPQPRVVDIDRITQTIGQFEQILHEINEAHRKLAVLQGELGNPVEALRALGYAVNEHWHYNKLYYTDSEGKYVSPEAAGIRDLSDRIAALVKLFTPSNSGFNPAGTQHVTYGAVEQLTYKKEQLS